MAAGGSKNHRTRTETARARLYAARAEWHAGRRRRRSRDNLVAGIAGGVLIAAAIASQFVHAEVTAEPEPVETSTPAPESTAPGPESTDPAAPEPDTSPEPESSGEPSAGPTTPDDASAD